MALLGQLFPTDITKLVMYAACVLLLAKLAGTKLYKAYPKFSFFIGFQIIRFFVLALLPVRSAAYGRIFFSTLPLLWILYVLVLLEVFQAALAEVPGVASFSRKFVISALGVGVTLAISTLFLNLQHKNPEYVLLENFVLADRVIELALLLFLLLLTAFLGYYPVAIHRNARIHTAIFSFYFFAKTAILLLRSTIGPSIANETNLAGRLLTTFCLLCWIFLLTKAGEHRVVRSNWIMAADQEGKMLAQLDAINATLLKTTKRHGVNGD